MKTIALTQGNHALVDDEDYPELNKYKWFYNNGYAARRNGGTRFITKTQYMHRFITTAPNGMEVDHINGNKLDNRKDNLRICSKSENQYNRNKNRGKYSSKYKGVSWRSKTQRWIVTFKSKGKTVYLGSFKNETDAALAYDQEVKNFHGEFAKLNFKQNHLALR